MSYNGIEVVHVVAMDQNNCIGKQGKLPWHIKEDLQRFKDWTTGGIVVMGRKTYESIGSALSNRVNIVVSRDDNFEPLNVAIAGSVDAAVSYAAQRAKKLGKDQIFIIGGAEIYAQTMDIVDRIELTRIKTFVKDGDTFYPKIDADIDNGIFKLVNDGLIKFDRFNYNFVTYVRRYVKKEQGEWCVVDSHGEIVYHGSSYDNAESWFYWNGGVERGYIVDELPVAAVANRELSEKVVDAMSDTLFQKQYDQVEMPKHPDFDRTVEKMTELKEKNTPFNLYMPEQPIGTKNDSAKPRYSLIPEHTLAAIVDVLEHGAIKYAVGNWKHVDNANERYYNATMRHIQAWWEGEPTDPETGLSHLAHAATNIMFLLSVEQQEVKDGIFKDKLMGALAE